MQVFTLTAVMTILIKHGNSGDLNIGYDEYGGYDVGTSSKSNIIFPDSSKFRVTDEDSSFINFPPLVRAEECSGCHPPIYISPIVSKGSLEKSMEFYIR